MKKLIVGLMSAFMLIATPALAVVESWGPATQNKTESGSGTFYSQLSQQTINYTYNNVAFDYEQVEETVVYGVLTMYGPNTADFDLGGLREIAFEGIETAGIPVYTDGQIHQEEVTPSGLYSIFWIDSTHMDFHTIITHATNDWYIPGFGSFDTQTVYHYGEDRIEAGDDRAWIPTKLTTEDGVVHQCAYKGNRTTPEADFPDGESYTKDGYSILKCDNVVIYNDHGEDYWIDDNIPAHPILNTNTPNPVTDPQGYQNYLDVLYNVCTSNGPGANVACDLYDQLVAANGS